MHKLHAISKCYDPRSDIYSIGVPIWYYSSVCCVSKVTWEYWEVSFVGWQRLSFPGIIILSFPGTLNVCIMFLL